jgi:hypothetical protein
LTQQHQKTGKKVSGTEAKTGKQNGHPKKPSKKELQGVVGQLSQTPDPFMAGVTAGIRFALGEDIPEIKAVLDKEAS